MLRTNSLCKPFNFINNFGYKCSFCVKNYLRKKNNDTNNNNNNNNNNNDVGLLCSSLSAFRDYNDMLGLLEHLIFDCTNNNTPKPATTSGIVTYNNCDNIKMNETSRKQLHNCIVTCDSNDLFNIKHVLDVAYSYRNDVKTYIYP